MKLSETQKHAILRLRGKCGVCSWDSERHIYIHMPYAVEERTYTSLENKGLVKYVSVPKYQYNGYILTDLGKNIEL